MKNHFKHCRGFSILEVLVAFSILALSLGVFYQIYSKGAHTTILGKEYTRATIIAQSRLNAFGIEDSPEASTGQGTEDDKYQWQVMSLPLHDENESNSEIRATLYKIDVEVIWNSLGKQRSITLNSLKLFPNERKL